jgi:hypothetical protein
VVLGEEEAAVVGYWLDVRAAMTDGLRECGMAGGACIRGVGVVVESEVEEVVASGIGVFRPERGPGDDSPDFLEPEEKVRVKMFFGI